MGYKPTGNPPGRPRKMDPKPSEPEQPVVQSDSGDEQPEAKPFPRAREGFRRAFADPADELHRPPRFGPRRTEVGKRPILHPNVIAKSE